MISIEHFYSIPEITKLQSELGTNNPFPEMQGFAYWLSLFGKENEMDDLTEWAKEQFPDMKTEEGVIFDGSILRRFLLKNDRDAMAFRLRIG